MTTGKTIVLTRWTFLGKAMYLLFNMLSRLITAFLPRSKCLLVSWWQSHLKWFWSPKKSVSIVSPSICHEVMGLDAMILVFWCWVLSHLFYSLLSLSLRGFLVPLHCLPLEWYHLHIWGCWYFSWQSWFQLMTHPAWHFTWCTLY